jgi:hypothetical protein
MNTNQFLESLKTLGKQYKFYLDEKGRIRCRQQGLCHCPITAICHAITKEYWAVMDYFIAGEKIGLHADVAKEIQCAVDKTPPMSLSQRSLRRLILKQLNLGESL